ncbi:cyclohexanone monooxygenase [Trichoderma arundinaceum]|uniref:Cyclohexanone monooxygenase n=1 Tax=Trichoderma arundinaceum TaxID=490622 RepID=A0A395NFF4_TRIAR|nr:cyclohexanone monooxygenase [Trichoderma arundinaceum]
MSANTKEQQVGALVVGAGFSGIYQLYKLRQLGLRVKAIEAASSVGGVWYTNHYPGATTDTQSEVFRYTWDSDDLQTYIWGQRYLPQSETLAYLEHVVKRHDLAKDIQLNTRMESPNILATLGESACPLIYYPNIPGLESFAGEIYHTADWPDHYDFKKKRVGIIGNGSTGVQLVVTLADQAKSTVSFEQHPQYVVPNGDGPVSTEYRQQINNEYPEILDKISNNWTGLNFMFCIFNDIVTVPKANKMATNFISGKIAHIVKGAAKARKLTPTRQYHRRPVTTKNYYQTFDQDNVDVANVLETPMEITSTGSLPRDLKPSLGTPLSSVPPLVEIQVEYITNLVAAAEAVAKKAESVPTVEVKHEAEYAWSMHVQEVANKTVFTGASSRLVGENVEGGGRRNIYCFGGLHTFRMLMEEEDKAGYPSFNPFCS